MTGRSPAVPEAGDQHVRGWPGWGLNLVGAVLSQAALFLVMPPLAPGAGCTRARPVRPVLRRAVLAGRAASLSGFRAGLTRFVAVHLADDDPAALRGAVRLGLGRLGRGVDVLAVGAGGRRAAARRRAARPGAHHRPAAGRADLPGAVSPFYGVRGGAGGDPGVAHPAAVRASSARSTKPAAPGRCSPRWPGATRGRA